MTRRAGTSRVGLALRSAALLAFSVANFCLVYLTARFLGGLAGWSFSQFAGLYGVFEASFGLANIVAPNFWVMPVARLSLPHEDAVVLRLADLRAIHWDGTGRMLAGAAFVSWSAARSGWGK